MGSSFDKMNEAIEQVERNNQDYYNDCFVFAMTWVQSQFKSFTSEDLKEAYFGAGNEPPREPRVFGAVFNKLSKAGLIFKQDWVYSKNPICHARPMRSWISLEFKQKQQSNAIRNKNQIGLNL
jgi:hypothetical protein